MRLADELVELMARPEHTLVTRVLEGSVLLVFIYTHIYTIHGLRNCFLQHAFMYSELSTNGQKRVLMDASRHLKCIKHCH